MSNVESVPGAPYEPPAILATLTQEDAACMVPADLTPHVHASQDS
jgi:hypothetical protein